MFDPRRSSGVGHTALTGQSWFPNQGCFRPVAAVLQVAVVAELDDELDAIGLGDVQSDGAEQLARADVGLV